MRTYGRIGQINGMGGTWIEIHTDVHGYNDQVYFTTLIQCLKLGLGESPFYANYGIPAVQSVMTQVAPDLYVANTQAQFAPYFASLIIQRVPDTASPTYNARAICHTGAILETQVAT